MTEITVDPRVLFYGCILHRTAFGLSLPALACPRPLLILLEVTLKSLGNQLHYLFQSLSLRGVHHGDEAL